MRRLMTMWLCATACILTVAQDIPEKIYVNRYSSEKRVDVVNGKYVAKGEVVVIEETFGIKVTEIIK